MRAGLSLDHVLIAVNDLDAAITNYQALGFNAFFGGKHAHGLTQNALVVFGDGVYLELIAPTGLTTEDPDGKNLLKRFEKGDGYIGYALFSADLDADSATIRERGLEMQAPTQSGRKRSDGLELQWKTASVDGHFVPFIIEDVTPRALRVPEDVDKVQQPNGVVSVTQLVVAVSDLDASIVHYKALLGSDERNGSPVEGARTVDFALGDTTVLTLAAPNTSSSPLATYLAKRGEVLYSLTMRTTDTSCVGLLDVTGAHGARIELVS